MVIILFFIFGLIVGSFLNVVVLRTRSGKSYVVGRSHCPACAHQLMWHDNMPLISFLILRGACRYCLAKISWQYPLVEFFTGALFAGAVLGSGLSLSLVPILVIFACFVIVFVYDAKYMEVPMPPLWTAVVVILIHNGVRDFSSHGLHGNIFSSYTAEGLLSGIGAFAFFYALSAYSKEQWMGYGDAYIALAMGLFLSWPQIFIALLFAFTIGAVWGVVLILHKGRTLKTQVPFGPFLLSGFFLMFFLDIFSPTLFR